MNSFPARYIGTPFIYLDSVDSTNNYAHNLIAKSDPSEGTAITAGYQTQGRGQIGRIWKGEADKNIYTSVIIKPTFIKPGDQFLINMALSVAINEFCTTILEETTHIKWPNDIYIGNRKICGILIQNTLSGSLINYAVIGIGINVNQESFQKDLPNPTSMCLERGKYFDLQILQRCLYNHIEIWYERLRGRELNTIKTKYKSSLYMLNKEMNFVAEGRYFLGEIAGVEDRGRLILRTNEGLQTFNLQEIKMIIDHLQL